MNTHPDTLNGLTYAELKPIIPTITKIYPMKDLCGETAEKICDKLRLPDSYNDDTLRRNLSQFFKTVSKQGLDGRHDIQQEYTGKDKPQWVFRFCDEWQGVYATKTEAIHAAQFFEVQRQKGFKLK